MSDPMDDMATLPPGTVLGNRYRVGELLGEGGMGQVYQATQLNLRRDVALKLLLNNLPDKDSGLKRFMREARVASALRHPNAVEIYDVGVDGPHVYIAMELLTGTVLCDMTERMGQPPLPTSLELTRQIADLLTTAHAMPLVHRDLKPANIFVEHDHTGQLRARVVDFGLAFIDGDDVETGRLTKEGLVVGTPAYLAPEQAQGIQIGPAADIYSLGCVLYELLTGQLVFRGSHMNILTQHVYVAPVSPRDRAPEAGIPSDLDDLVLRMLSKRPEDRPTAEELVAHLATVTGTLAGQRHRGRDDRLLAGRAERMISVPDKTAPALDREAVKRSVSTGEQSLDIAVYGEFTEDIWLGLASNGLCAEPMGPQQDPAEAPCDAILTRVDDLDRISELVATGIPVVAIPPASRVELLAELLRRNVSDVLSPPLKVEEVARKLRRAVNRHRRQLRRKR